MIEAEAALKKGDVTTYLAKLNDGRATVTGLTPLTDPGSTAARENLLSRERAFCSGRARCITGAACHA